MTQASAVIDAALKKLNVASSISPATPDQQNDAFDLLREMLARWEKNGVDIDVFVPDAIDDDLDEPEWVTSCIKNILAKELAPTFQAPISSELASQIKDSEALIEIHGIAGVDPVIRKGTPRGAGNRIGPRSRTFF